MALSKKYAGLPDLDPAPEIYETPELIDDVSTIQTGTIRSESPSPSEEGRHDPDTGLDRQRIDRDEARRRFDRSVVDARDVDFSDRVGADRKSYVIKSRRRRYRKRTESVSEGSSESEEESIPARLARLRREAEELRIELEKRDNEESSAKVNGDSAGVGDDLSRLSMTLDGLQASSRRKTEAPAPKLPSTQPEAPAQADATRALPPETSPSTIAAISSFSDRLTSLESALGLSATLPTTAPTTSILPTLAQLTTQITTLTSTLTTMRTPQYTTSSLPTLDDLTTRVRNLVSETDKLTLSRKSALQSLQDLQEARLRASASAAYGGGVGGGHARQPSVQSVALAEQTATQQRTESRLFLDEQSAKIAALYELLPTIQSLHPLLPTVLDRLRSLQVVHAGAAEARSDLDDIEARQARMDEELKRWREGLDAVQRGMKKHAETSLENVRVVTEMVEGLEGRLDEALK